MISLHMRKLEYQEKIQMKQMAATRKLKEKQ